MPDFRSIGLRAIPQSPSGPFSIFRRRSRRSVFNQAMNGLVMVGALIATVPLISVLYVVIVKGLAGFRFAMLWELPPGANMEGGGFGNAIVGTLLMVGLATLISVPFGVATAAYLTEFYIGAKQAQVIRFAAKILSGLPSIIAGVFVFASVVMTVHRFSLFAGALALTVLMLPIVTLSAEEALLRVPNALREASQALGATTAQTVLRVVIPAARSALLTGVSLAIARATGETAPLIFTALFSEYWIRGLLEPTASLSVLIYNFSGVPYENQIQMAWSASLVLILGVLVTNLSARYLSRGR